MPTRPDPFPRLAAKRAESNDVRRLFEKLDVRAQVFSGMMDEFTEAVARNRQSREGKAFKLSEKQKRTIGGFEGDAERAVHDLERSILSMDDTALLNCAISGVDQAIQLDEGMLSSWHTDDRSSAIRLIEYQRETKSLIEEFVEMCHFSGKIRSIWHDKNITKLHRDEF